MQTAQRSDGKEFGSWRVQEQHVILYDAYIVLAFLCMSILC